MIAITVAIVVVGFLIALWIVSRIVTTALASTSDPAQTTAIANALSSVGASVGDSVAKALAPPELVNQAEAPTAPEPVDWQDGSGDYDTDLIDGFEAFGGATMGPAAVMSKEPRGD